MHAPILAGLAAILCLTGTAQAQISEVRVGVVVHDLARDIEDGVQIAGQIVFDSPDFLSPVWSPRPYVYGSFNSQGNTNLGSAGLLWTGSFTDRLSVDGGFGIAYHDGVRDVSQLPADDPDRIRLAGSRALLGSRFLFHTQLGVDYAVTPRLAVGVYYEHFSNGQILGQGRNQGLDEIGARLSWRFGR
ncbi:MAG: putative outer membrane receptor [Oceanicaulis sp. HLUCCA04]|nr:MAG: putative outer membrane receptor [Oceanicaulis sp. HLUCCA04]